MAYEDLGVAKLQLAFWCNWLWKLLKLWDMPSLQEMSYFLFISMTGFKVAQRIQVVSILLHEAKPTLCQFSLVSLQLVEVVMW